MRYLGKVMRCAEENLNKGIENDFRLSRKVRARFCLKIKTNVANKKIGFV